MPTTLFIAGANVAYAHPVLFRRIEDARRANPALRIVVVDPRRTDTAELADLHLALAPGTDVALFHGMLHVLLWDGLLDAAFIERSTTGFAALKERVREFTPRATARLCGIAEADLVQAAHWFGQRGATAPGATLSLYCQGLNQSRRRHGEECGADQPASGDRTDRQAGRRSVVAHRPAQRDGRTRGRRHGDPGERAPRPRGRAAAMEIAALWGFDAMPARPGKTAVEMFEAAADGTIKALWIACTNPAQSMPDQALVRRALERAEFVVVQEAFATTATARYADLLLPAATWGEKDGTVTNSERRISRVRRALEPPGAARPDWRIGVDLAQRLEARWHPGHPTRFAYASPEAIWNEHRESTRGRDLDITGLSYDLLERAGPQQWPCAAGAAGGRVRLYADGRFPTPDGRARFADVAYRPLAEPRDVRYPFSLLTGRLRDQWHGMSRTGTVATLFGHDPEPAIELHPRDMERIGVGEGDLVHVTSRRGSIIVPARSAAGLMRTQAFMAMHWGDEYLGGSTRTGQRAAGVNALTLPAFCPVSRQPELKHAAVKILRAELPWGVLAMAWLPPGRALRVQHDLQAIMAAFAYAACVPFGSAGTDRVGVQFRAAGTEPADAGVLARIEALLDLAGTDVLRYADRRHGQWRTMRLDAGAGERRLGGFLLAGDTASAAWVRELLLQQLAAQPYGRLLLKGGAAAPAGLMARSAQVCACFDVCAAQIDGFLERDSGAAQEQLARLQERLRCGTGCGSCLPELRRRLRAAPAAA